MAATISRMFRRLPPLLWIFLFSFIVFIIIVILHFSFFILHSSFKTRMPRILRLASVPVCFRFGG